MAKRRIMQTVPYIGVPHTGEWVNIGNFPSMSCCILETVQDKGHSYCGRLLGTCMLLSEYGLFAAFGLYIVYEIVENW